jgi:hypothetical protein
MRDKEYMQIGKGASWKKKKKKKKKKKPETKH